LSSPHRLVVGYVILVLAVAGVMELRLPRSPRPRAGTQATPKGSEMQWTQVIEIVVPARPTGVWTWAVDYVKGPARILVEAVDGTWTYSSGRPACGADGDLESLLSADGTILPTAPSGALLVKIGGSTAGVNDGTVRVAGRKAYLEIEATVSGPVFLTINDQLGGMSDNAGELKVRVSIATIQAVPHPSGAGSGSTAAGGSSPASGQ
jgi:hypothetical protein